MFGLVSHFSWPSLALPRAAPNIKDTQKRPLCRRAVVEGSTEAEIEALWHCYDEVRCSPTQLHSDGRGRLTWIWWSWPRDRTTLASLRSTSCLCCQWTWCASCPDPDPDTANLLASPTSISSCCSVPSLVLLFRLC